MSRALNCFVFAFGLALAVAACGGEDLTGGFPDAGGSTNACGPSNCAGCCTQEGACITNIWDRQCGAGGQICTDCTTSGRGCNETGQCQEPDACNAANCPDGCCVGDECVAPGDSDDACGTSGTQCQICDAERGHQCDGEQCRAPCGPDTCAGCCVDQFTCRDIPNERACGGGGEPCEDCGVDGLCTGDGQCVDASCANTCSGCCTEDGDCIDGGDNLEDAQCGRRGELCVECASGEFCADPGRCISEACTDSCQGGCCDPDGTCHPGGTPTSCGAGAQACINCLQEGLWGEHSICGGDGECRLDPNSRWDVIIENAEVPLLDQNGRHWDTFPNQPPDPYVVMTVGLGTGDERTNQTHHINNVTFADYDSFVIHESVRAEQLMTPGQVQFMWFDDDFFTSDDQMSLPKSTFIPEELFTGALLIYRQIDEYEDAENSPLEFIVRFRVIPTGGEPNAHEVRTQTVGGEWMCTGSEDPELAAVDRLY
jgi:hypothetical protein